MTKRYNPSANEYEGVSTFYDFTENHNEFIEKMWADEDDSVVDIIDNPVIDYPVGRRWTGVHSNTKVKRINEVSKKIINI